MLGAAIYKRGSYEEIIFNRNSFNFCPFSRDSGRGGFLCTPEKIKWATHSEVNEQFSNFPT